MILVKLIKFFFKLSKSIFSQHIIDTYINGLEDWSNAFFYTDFYYYLELKLLRLIVIFFLNFFLFNAFLYYWPFETSKTVNPETIKILKSLKDCF